MKKTLIIAALLMASSTMFAQKVAHVNSQEVILLMPESEEVRNKLEQINKDNETALKEMYAEYQSKGQEYQNKEATWTDAVKQSKYKELMDFEQRIQETQQSIQQEMQSIQSRLTAPVMEKFQKALKDIAQQEGYLYVFDSAAALYIDPAQSVDITARLRKALNVPEGRTLEALQAEIQAKQQAAASQN